MACCDHASPERTNTYAEPASVPATVSTKYAPATTVSPEIATEAPNRSMGAASEAVSFCCSVHVSPERTNT